MTLSEIRKDIFWNKEVNTSVRSSWPSEKRRFAMYSKTNLWHQKFKLTITGKNLSLIRIFGFKDHQRANESQTHLSPRIILKANFKMVFTISQLSFSHVTTDNIYLHTQALCQFFSIIRQNSTKMHRKTSCSTRACI